MVHELQGDGSILLRGIRTRGGWLVAVVFWLLSTAAFGHSIEDVEAALHDRQPHAQFVRYPAPEFRLADVNGDIVTSEDMRGQVVILNFIYTRCDEACPIHQHLIGQVQHAVNARGLHEDVVFITIATDTEDIASTRRIMREMGERFRMGDRNWQFLFRQESDPPEITGNLAAEYGVRFEVVDEGVQMHGIVIHVIDGYGDMRARFHGLLADTEPMVSYVTALVQGPEAVPVALRYRFRRMFNSLFD
ncbi:SCO family protein [Natronospirillum operosum]|uniref:SCO family protein n=1 Tax=Natronospirillum operosum TaxID=2759953 RepID=UPI001436A469|nr:SCO family protein [Natronospirillum operosum]